jgi:cell division protein FtsI (penicillin-binding protein 3)
MRNLQCKFSNKSFSKNRISLLKFFILFFIPTVLILKLFIAQVWQYDTLLPLIKKQISSNITITIPRGEIFDRNFRILATNLEFENISINSAEFLKGLNKNRNNLTLLSQITNIPQEEILKKVYQEKYFSLNKKVPLSLSYKLKKIRGLDFNKVVERFYPNQDLLRYVLGGVDKDNKGYSGIEREFESLLCNMRTKELYVYKNGNINNTSLRLANLSDIDEIENKQKNCSIVLTIDSKLQYKIEKVLQSAYEKFLPQKIMCVIEDPYTGEILVMATYPPEEKPLSNPVVNSAFEPGSIFKIFPVAIFLEENVVTKDTIFDCENGKFYYAGNEISDLKPHKYLSMKDIIVYSSNIGMSKAYLKFNNPWKYCSFLKLFGFGTLSGIELPGELRGWLVTPANIRWSNYQPIAMSFGQGIFVTAIQMVNAYSAIANGGELLQPHIVKNILNSNNEIVYTSTKTVVRRVVTSQTCETIKEMLEETVLRGTAVGTKIDGINICAKTGTAQKYDPQIKKYSNTKSLISVCGFFPKENPKYVIGIFFDEPTVGRLASDVAVPIFKKIVMEILNIDEEIVYAKAN